MLFPLIAFVCLLIFGRIQDELSWRQIGLFLLIGIVSLILLQVFHAPAFLYIVILALLDIVLVLIVFKGDIQIR